MDAIPGREKESWSEPLRVAQAVAIARVCHAANKAWCEANGDYSQKPWDEAEQWQRDSAILGVKFRLDNPGAKHDAQHNDEELPEFQQKKDALFCAIVDALK